MDQAAVVFPVSTERTVLVANDTGQTDKCSGGGVGGWGLIERRLPQTMDTESRGKASDRRRCLNPQHVAQKGSVYSEQRSTSGLQQHDGVNAVVVSSHRRVAAIRSP